MVQDILLKTHRVYRSSSSFKVATLFALLLGIAVAALFVALFFLYSTAAQQSIDNIVLLLGIFGIVSLLFIAIGGYLISMFVVSRINRIADTASDIMDTGDLSKRLEVDSRWDDLSFLSNVLNELLDKIAVLMEGVQHITDTVAHDLRTPLSRLRNKLEQIDDQLLTTEDRHKLKLELINEVDGLLKTFNSLLRLSSLESGRQGLVFENFDLNKVLQDAFDLYAPLAEEKKQTILIKSSSMQYLGDRDLIFQVVANLLDNAIKFTSSGGKIEVTLDEYQSRPRLTISDNGIGIDPDLRSRVFDRFYRVDAQAEHKGAGLGLSIVIAVLKLHKAEVVLEDNNPGLRAIISF